MKTAFINKRFQESKLTLLSDANSIIAAYQAQGLRLTLRQLYYQMVVRNILPNIDQSYYKLGTAVSEGRLAGLVDWDAIEDRTRRPNISSEFRGLEDLVQAALYSYRLPRWSNQEHYVELWVEKDALSGVLAPLANTHHVTLMVNRGYSSQSAMHDAYRRFQRREREGKRCVLFYLGDHDPSGEDMVRDIRDRLQMFGVDVEVQKLALTMEQVQEYNPPPNPAKVTDSRFAKYAAEFGDESWEVDALPPEVLNALITAAFSEVIDQAALQEVLDQEEEDKILLTEAVRSLRNGH